MDTSAFINKDYLYAVIGASRDPEKYGNRILRDLKSAGYKVIPINPNADEVEGLKSYPSVTAYQTETGNKIDVVDIVVPPNVTESLLPKLQQAGITKVWLQPGSESAEAIRYCEENDMKCIHNACIMVKRLDPRD